jgi:hypothetical protein
VHCWSTFGVRTSYGQIWTNKTHHGSDLGEPTTFPLIVYFVTLHKAHIQMAFLSGDSQMGVSKLPKLGLLQFWGPITFCADLQLRWGLKQSYSPHQELSNARKLGRFPTFSGQESNCQLTISFDHILCFKCLNGSCELILYIYVSIYFQWYKTLLNSMGFDPCNRSLKIRESIGTPTPKMGTHFGSLSVHSHTLPHSREHEMWLLGFLLGLRPCKPLHWSQAQG